MNPSIQDVKKIASIHFGVPLREIDSQRRNREIVRVRQITMAAVKRLTSRSLPEIGRHFGNRDHTTVLHSVRKIESLVEKDASIASDLAAIVDQFDVTADVDDEEMNDRLCVVAARLVQIVTGGIREYVRSLPGSPDSMPAYRRPAKDTVTQLIDAAHDLASARFTNREKDAIERVIAAGQKARSSKGEPKPKKVA